MSYSDIKELLKDAKNFAAGANDLQLKSILLDIQDKIFELQEENRELKIELHDLKNKNILESELEYRNNAYFKENNEEIPYCSRCYDVDKKLVIMESWAPYSSPNYEYKCPQCKNSYDSLIPYNSKKH